MLQQREEIQRLHIA